MPLKHCDFEDVNCCVVCREHNNGVYYLAEENTPFCSRHGAHSSAKAVKEKNANMYRAQIWQARIKHFANADGVKSLRDEVAILRMVLDETLTQCQSEDKLTMMSSRIAALTQDIGKLILSCDRLERNMGEMLDKPTAIRFAAKIIEILDRYIDDTDILDKISTDILEALG